MLQVASYCYPSEKQDLKGACCSTVRMNECADERTKFKQSLQTLKIYLDAAFKILDNEQNVGVRQVGIMAQAGLETGRQHLFNRCLCVCVRARDKRNEVKEHMWNMSTYVDINIIQKKWFEKEVSF